MDFNSIIGIVVALIAIFGGQCWKAAISAPLSSLPPFHRAGGYTGGGAAAKPGAPVCTRHEDEPLGICSAAARRGRIGGAYRHMERHCRARRVCCRSIRTWKVSMILS